MDGAGDREAVEEFCALDGVAAGEHRARLGHGLEPAAEDFLEGVLAELLERIAHQVHGGERGAAHGPDIGQGVGGGDPAEGVGVVHHGWEEVGGVDDGEFVGDLHHSGVVGGFDADDEVVGLEPRQTAENGVEQPLGELGAAAAIGRALGELDGVDGLDGSKGARRPGPVLIAVDRFGRELERVEDLGQSARVRAPDLEDHTALGAHRTRRRHRIDIETALAGGALGAHDALHRAEDDEEITVGWVSHGSSCDGESYRSPTVGLSTATTPGGVGRKFETDIPGDDDPLDCGELHRRDQLAVLPG